MIQNILGILVGAAVALVALIIINANSWEEYVIGLVIGGIGTFLWPVVAGVWLARRADSRRADRIEDEVSRQMNAQKKP